MLLIEPIPTPADVLEKPRCRGRPLCGNRPALVWLSSDLARASKLALASAMYAATHWLMVSTGTLAWAAAASGVKAPLTTLAARSRACGSSSNPAIVAKTVDSACSLAPFRITLESAWL